jgi:hypothetical protein
MLNLFISDEVIGNWMPQLSVPLGKLSAFNAFSKGLPGFTRSRFLLPYDEHRRGVTPAFVSLGLEHCEIAVFI